MQPVQSADRKASSIVLVAGLALSVLLSGVASGIELQDSAPATQPATQPSTDTPPAKRPGRGVAPAPKPVAPGQQPAPAPAPVDTAPGQPSAPTDPAAPQTPVSTPKVKEKEGPTRGLYVTRQGNGKDYLMTATVRVNSDNSKRRQTFTDPFTKKTVDMPVITPFKFETLGMIWPAMPSTSASDPYPKQVRAQLTLNDKVVDDTATLIEDPNYGGVGFFRLDASDSSGAIECREVQMAVEIPVTIYKVKYDEKAALQVGWPTGPWPAEVQSALQDKPWIEYGFDAAGTKGLYPTDKIDAAMVRWLKEAGAPSWSKLPPAYVAKVITSKLWGTLKLNGKGFTYNTTGEVSGIDIKPPEITFIEQGGSAFDATALLTLCLRKAGVPTRMVFGRDGGGGKLGSSGKGDIRSWCEFALYDEGANTLNWVIIDIAKLAKSSNRPQALGDQWKWFGTHDEMDNIVPFALHFSPTTTVAFYGSPGFWGWFVTPKAPESAEQAVRVSMAMASKSSNEPRQNGEKPSDPPKKRSGY